MKQTRHVLFVVFLFALTLAHGQSYTFKVLVCKGKTEVKSGESWSNIKVGSHLNLTDEIKVSENAYLGLLHSSGKPMELKTSGSYTVTTLSSKMGKESSVMNKYADFVLSQAEDKKNRLAATGAVHRDLKMPVTVYLPKTTEHIGNNIVINWQAPDNAESFDVVVYEMHEDELAKFHVEGKKWLSINVNEGKMKEFPVLIVKVFSKNGNESDRYTIKKIQGPRKTALETSLAEIQPLMTEQSALEKYILASFYEEKMLLSDAATAYKEAAEMAPEAYNQEYHDFLVRLGFSVQ